MKIGIVAALAFEARLLGPRVFRQAEILPLSDRVDAVWSGMGPVKAEEAARLLVARGARMLVSWGTAGGLADHVHPGDLILPGRIVAADGSAFSTDAVFVENVCTRLPSGVTARREPVVEGLEILKTPSAKRELGQRSGAVAVDLESASVARVARERGVSFVAIRAVVDDVSVPLPQSLAPALTSNGQMSPWKLAWAPMFRPGEWPAVWRLRSGFSRASRTLRTVGRIVVAEDVGGQV